MAGDRMTRRMMRPAAAVAAAAAGAVLAGSAGCGSVWLNLTKEKTGTISFVFINDTEYRASFSYGTYDAWDRSPPGAVTLQQIAVAPHTTTAPQSVTCRRNAAVATQEFVDRVLATDADRNLTTFEPDRFDSVVHFSSAPADSDAADLPTQGTAAGREVLLGIDFSCGDQLVFTFVEDPDAEGGYRIDFEVIRNEDIEG